MAPTYKLYYFNFTGRGEPIRMMFSYGGIPFEDIRIDQKEWAKVKPTTPLGQVPYLEIDGKIVTQSAGICRYLSNIVGLAGKSNEENLDIDIAVGIVGDLVSAAYAFHFEPDEARKKKAEEKLNNYLSLFLKALEESAKKNGGFLGAPRLTWADIFFVAAYEDVRNIKKGEEILSNHPNLQQVKKNVLAVKKLQDWVKKRPLIPIYVYDLRTEL